jgi:hypothetical protein
MTRQAILIPGSALAGIIAAPHAESRGWPWIGAYDRAVRRCIMTTERTLRGIAGSFVLLSLILAHYVSPWWLVFTAFVGVNLLQSAFTNWCPMMWVLEKAGARHGGISGLPGAQGSL